MDAHLHHVLPACLEDVFLCCRHWQETMGCKVQCFLPWPTLHSHLGHHSLLSSVTDGETVAVAAAAAGTYMVPFVDVEGMLCKFTTRAQSCQHRYVCGVRHGVHGTC